MHIILVVGVLECEAIGCNVSVKVSTINDKKGKLEMNRGPPTKR